MAEPLTAEYRLRLDIVVGGLTHKMRQFCEASASLLAASGYFLFDRSGLATIDAGDAAQSFWTMVASVYGTSVTAPQWILENRSGVVWNPVTAGTTTGTGAITGSYFDATQFTISMRSTLFTRLRLIILEQNKTQNAAKINSLSALSASWSAALAAGISGSDSDASGYFQWARSKNKRELNATSPFISSTFDLNDKVRRSRNIQ